MQSRKLILLGTLMSFSFFSGVMGCGEGADSPGPDLGSGSTTLSISPAGPISVKKGLTIDFDTNISGATFSVVGGDNNGSISPDGIYTPPATLPINQKVTIQANLDSQTASAIVNLITADTLSLQAGSKKQINDVPLDTIAILSEMQYSNLKNKLALAQTSTGIKLYPFWTYKEGANLKGLLDLSSDFGPFGTDLGIRDTLNNPIAGSIQVDSNNRIHLVTIEVVGGIRQVIHYSSNDGLVFTPHVIHADPEIQAMPSLKVDDQNHLHLAYAQAITGGSEVLYTQSTDGGVTWSSSKKINPIVSPRQLQPALAISADGKSLEVCWSEYLGTKTDIFANHSSDAGLNFSTAKNLSNTAVLSEGQCQIERGLAGEMYVIFSGLFNFISIVDTEIFFSKSLDQGLNFSIPKVVNSDTAHYQAMPSFAVDALGRMDVLWSSDVDVEGSDNMEVIMYSRSIDGGNNFSANIPLIQDPATSVAIVSGLTQDESGRLHIQYLNRTVNVDLFYQMAE